MIPTPRVVSLGLDLFARTLQALDVPVVHVAWSPPAGGDALAVIGIVFVVLVILELVGVIDIFKKT